MTQADSRGVPGTSGSPSILNASPEAAAGGNLGLVEDGDILRVDLNARTVTLKVSEEVLEQRRKAKGPYKFPKSQTPWQEYFRKDVDQLNEGMVLKSAIKYQKIAQTFGVPRDNH